MVPEIASKLQVKSLQDCHIAVASSVGLRLLSPYPCFISLLYLDLYVLGDDTLIS